MSKVIHLISLSLLLLLGGCKRDDDPIERPGTVEFVLRAKTIEGNAGTLENAKGVVLSIMTDDGSHYIDQRLVRLSQANGRVVTDQLELMPGRYHLYFFLVTDEENNGTHATPVAGSAMASSLEHPLPITFTVVADELLSQDIEVMDISTSDPQLYGYQSFDLTVMNKRLVRMSVALGSIPATNVRTWIRNIDTFERQWVTLYRIGSSYMGTAILKPGQYEFEAFATWNEGGMRYVKTQVITASIQSNSKLEFGKLQQAPLKRIHPFAHGTATTPVDFCDPLYTLYLGADVCSGTFVFDKLVVTSEQAIYLGKDKGSFHDNRCGAGDPEAIMNTGKIVRAIPLSTTQCDTNMPTYEAANSFGHFEVILKDGTSASYHVQDQYKPTVEMSPIE